MIPHGSYEIFRSGNVLRVTAVGPFNTDALANYGRAYESVVKEIPEGPWAVLGIFQGESLFIPEAEDKLIEITRWRIQQRMKAVALVLNPTVANDVVRAQVARIYQLSGANHALFRDESAAHTWIESQGFQYDPKAAKRHSGLS